MKKTFLSPLLGGFISTFIFWLYSLTHIHDVAQGLNITGYFQTALSLLLFLLPVFLITSYVIFFPSIWAIKKVQMNLNLTEKQMWFITYVLFLLLGIFILFFMRNQINDNIALGILSLICLPFGMLFNTSFYSVLSGNVQPRKK